jgi:predicted SAM-dependent methyltransferase
MDEKARNELAREELARELHGHGVEFGPGCHPVKLGPCVSSIRYCDVFDRAGYAALFPEVGAAANHFPDPIHFQLQFDREPFADRIGRESLDFVVANHVLEHLINPIRFLEQCFQVLKLGGLLYLGLPDKRRIFDRYRRRTPLSDLIVRYETGETEVSAERVAEYLNQVEWPAEQIRPDNPEHRALIEWHARRSIHVNVWMLDDIIELLQHLGRHRDMPWALYDGMVGGGEFLLLLRKSDRQDVLDAYPSTLARLYAEATQRRLEQAADQAAATLVGLEREVGEMIRFVRGFKKVAGSMPGGGLIGRWAKKG